MGDLRRLLLVSTLACTLACQSAELRSPAEGGKAWTLTQTDNFRLYSDLEPDDAALVIKQLETDLRALSTATFKNPSPVVEPTDVVVFSNGAHFHHFAPPSLQGVFYRGLKIQSAESRHLVVTHGGLDETTRTTLMHELTHDLFARNFGPAPPWLDEGWAQFYSTIRVDGGDLHLGEPLPNLAFTSERSPFVGSRDGMQVIAIPVESVALPSALMRMTSKDFYQFSQEAEPSLEDSVADASRYLGAWALVHLLMDGNNPYSKRYGEFQKGVLQSSVSEAWAHAFQGVDPGQFDRDFRTYLYEGRLTVYTLPYEEKITARVQKTRPLADAEVHTLWARLFIGNMFHAQGQDEEAQKELNLAIKRDPKLAEAYYYRALLARHQGKLKEAYAAIERASSLAPDDSRFLLTFLHIHIEQSGGELNEEQARALLPQVEKLASIGNSPQALLFAAHYFISFGQRDRALELNARAVQLSPVDPFILSDAALVLEAAGQFEQAIEHERAALAFLNEDRGAEERIKRDLERMKAALASTR